MQAKKLLICEDEALTTLRLRTSLTRRGYSVVGEAQDGLEAVSAATRLQPDVILMDIEMPRLDGISATRQIMSVRPTAIVMLTAYCEQDLIDTALAAGASGYLVKPISEAQIDPAIQVALRRFHEVHALQGEVAGLKETLEARKVLERAKGVLMRHYQISEAEAHRRLQKMSRDRHQALLKTAEQVLTAVEALG